MKIFLHTFLIATLLLFTGCELQNPFGPSKEELALQQKAMENEQLLKEKELNAKIEQNKESLQVKKDLELAKINSEVEKQKLLTQNKEKENTYKLQSEQQSQNLQLQQYYLLLAGFALLILAVALFVYFNNRRKDKLRAYEDNLDKYFRSKENQARVEIANKIIDTIASGKLNDTQEARLISTLNGDSSLSQETIKEVEEEPVMEIEVLESPKEKKKKKKKKEKKGK